MIELRVLEEKRGHLDGSLKWPQLPLSNGLQIDKGLFLTVASASHDPPLASTFAVMDLY